MRSIERVPDVMTPDQAADYLQVNRETVYRYIRDGKLLASKLGRAYRIPKSSLDVLLWSTRTRPDITLRNYSSSQLDAFIADDKLTGKAKDIAEQVAKIMERRPAPN